LWIVLFAEKRDNCAKSSAFMLSGTKCVHLGPIKLWSIVRVDKLSNLE